MKPSIKHLPKLLQEFAEVAPNFTAVGSNFLMYHDIKIKPLGISTSAIQASVKLPVRDQRGQNSVESNSHNVVNKNTLNKIKEELVIRIVQHCLGTNEAVFLFR